MNIIHQIHPDLCDKAIQNWTCQIHTTKQCHGGYLPYVIFHTIYHKIFFLIKKESWVNISHTTRYIYIKKCTRNWASLLKYLLEFNYEHILFHKLWLRNRSLCILNKIFVYTVILLICIGLDLFGVMSLGEEIAKHDDIARKSKVVRNFIKTYQDCLTALEKVWILLNIIMI